MAREIFHVCERGHQWPGEVGVPATDCPVCGRSASLLKVNWNIPWKRLVQGLFVLGVLGPLGYALFAGMTGRADDEVVTAAVVGGLMLAFLAFIVWMARAIPGNLAKFVLVMQDFGKELGFVYSVSMHKLLRNRLQKLKLISRFSRSYLLQGNFDGNEVLICRFNGHHRSGFDYHWLPVLVVFTDALPGTPAFVIDRKVFVSRAIKNIFGPNSNAPRTATIEEFEKHYLIESRDKTPLRCVVSDEVVEFFARNPGWHVESDGNNLLLFRDRRRLSFTEHLFDDRVPTRDDLIALWDESREIRRLFRSAAQEANGRNQTSE